MNRFRIQGMRGAAKGIDAQPLYHHGSSHENVWLAPVINHCEVQAPANSLSGMEASRPRLL